MFRLVQPDELIFLSGATESVNYALKGAAFTQRGMNVPCISISSSHIVYGGMLYREHTDVLTCNGCCDQR